MTLFDRLFVMQAAAMMQRLKTSCAQGPKLEAHHIPTGVQEVVQFTYTSDTASCA